MKKTILAASLSLLPFTTNAVDFVDYARVLSAYPVTERVETPHTECGGAAPVESASERKFGGALVGAVVGGLLGAQVGKGSGKTAAAAVGAAAGAIVGDRTQNRPGSEPAPTAERNCQTTYRIVTREIGYDVTYEFHGQRVTERLAKDPGSQVRVSFSVRAAE